jgi:hypothetical protein
MKQFLQGILSVFSAKNSIYQSRLDSYVASKRPSSTAEVERLIKEFEHAHRFAA